MLGPRIARWALQVATQEAKGLLPLLNPKASACPADVLCRSFLENSSLAWWLLDPGPAGYNASGVPATTGWTLSYQRGRAITGTRPHLSAYTVNTHPLVAGPYAPAPPAVWLTALNACRGGSS